MAVPRVRGVVLAGLAGLAALAACGADDGLAPGTCITRDDCLGQPGFGIVCYHGVCVMCAVDTDCGQGQVCTAHRCVAGP